MILVLDVLVLIERVLLIHSTQSSSLSPPSAMHPTRHYLLYEDQNSRLAISILSIPSSPRQYQDSIPIPNTGIGSQTSLIYTHSRTQLFEKRTHTQFMDTYRSQYRYWVLVLNLGIEGDLMGLKVLILPVFSFDPHSASNDE